MYKTCKTPQSALRQRRIVDCMLAMMQNQTFDKITVQALCRKAEVPRKAFYRYFACKEDVLVAAVDFLTLEEPGFEWQKDGSLENVQHQRENIERLLVFWAQRRSLLDAITRSRMLWMLVQRWAVPTGGEQPGTPGAGPQAVRLFVAAGLLAVLTDWIGRGCQEPAGQVAELVSQMACRAAAQQPAQQ